MDNFSLKLELISLVLQLALLAVVLSFVGLAVRKFLIALTDSRRQARMREQTVVAAASYAGARARARVTR